MSKKNRRQKGKFTSLWIVLGVGSLLLVIAGLLLVGRDNGGTPAIGVDQEAIDYGQVKLDTPLSFSIKVTNTGDGVLRFREKPYVEVKEGC